MNPIMTTPTTVILADGREHVCPCCGGSGELLELHRDVIPCPCCRPERLTADVEPEVEAA